MSSQRIEEAVRRQIGFRLDRIMRQRLDRSIRLQAGVLGVSLDGYAELVERDASARQTLVEHVVVPTTAFFRHPEQFVALVRCMAAWPDPLVVWSAACSIGAEPYSLAMVLAESGRAGWRVVATDVSSPSLKRAEAGFYEERELIGLSPQRRQRHMERCDHGWRMIRDLRERVVFVPHNLMAPEVPRVARAAASVFCRNVLIYLQPEVQRAFLERIVTQLPDLRALFLGGTESVLGLTDRFAPVYMDGAYVYRPVTGAVRSPARAAPGRPRTGQAAPAPASRATADRLRPAQAATTGPERHEQDSAAFLAQGRAALERGDLPASIAAFRKACYVDSDSPIGHLNLGLALEAAGYDGAPRAFAAALAAVRRRGPDRLDAELEGFSAGELVRLLSGRLGIAP
jgi:chemotaxis methyl-accepting protein methylase